MRTILKFLAAAAILYLGYLLVGQAVMLGWIHGWVQDHYGDLTGADRTVGWLVALAVFALIRLVRWRPVPAGPGLFWPSPASVSPPPAP